MAMILTLMILISIAGSATAQEDKPSQGVNVHTAPSQGQGPTDAAELEAFLDEVFGKQMEEYNVAGAAFSVVKDGKPFFTKGYGYAALKRASQSTPKRRSSALAPSATGASAYVCITRWGRSQRSLSSCS